MTAGEILRAAKALADEREFWPMDGGQPLLSSAERMAIAVQAVVAADRGDGSGGREAYKHWQD